MNGTDLIRRQDAVKCILQGTVFCNECKPIHDAIKSPVEVDDGGAD